MPQNDQPGKPGGRWDTWTVFCTVLIAVLLAIAAGFLGAALIRAF